MRDFSPAMLHAFEDTIFAYDVAIADLENGMSSSRVAERWRISAYGTYGGCHLCWVVRIPGSNLPRCELCLLGPVGVGCTHSREADITMKKLMEQVYDHTTKTGLLQAFKARRAWLVSKAGANGIVLEDA